MNVAIPTAAMVHARFAELIAPLLTSSAISDHSVSNALAAVYSEWRSCQEQCSLSLRCSRFSGRLTGMSSSPSTDARPLSRRDRLRRATVTEIKALACQQLVEEGPGALSLRAIARQMGTASSALYRYFAGYDELLSALCVDAYTALADQASAARDTQPPDDPARQWWAICNAFRRWALDNPADFALIFGSPVPDYQAPEPVTGPAAGRATAIPLNIYAAAVAAGHADPDRTQVPQDFEVSEFLRNLLADA